MPGVLAAGIGEGAARAGASGIFAVPGAFAVVMESPFGTVTCAAFAT